MFQPLSNESLGVPLILFWADALGASRNDYDLYVFDAAGVRAFSQDVQNGDDDPFEGFDPPPAAPCGRPWSSSAATPVLPAHGVPRPL